MSELDSDLKPGVGPTSPDGITGWASERRGRAVWARRLPIITAVLVPLILAAVAVRFWMAGVQVWELGAWAA